MVLGVPGIFGCDHRSYDLRERLRCRPDWKIRHLPGSELVADFLTKPINPRTKWEYFFKFLGMIGIEENRDELKQEKADIEDMKQM